MIVPKGVALNEYPEFFKEGVETLKAKGVDLVMWYSTNMEESVEDYKKLFDEYGLDLLIVNYPSVVGKFLEEVGEGKGDDL